MSADFFLDTNVLVYSFDEREPRKRDIASGLVERALSSGNGAISYQVVQEFLNLATRKFANTMSGERTAAYLRGVLEPLCTVHSSMELYRHALDVHGRWRFHLYDSLIVAAALDAGCELLYSEDLQHGQTIESVTVVNPFLDDRAVHEPASPG